jgi:hypothetical protein
MTVITIDVECKDRFGMDRHFCTVVGSVMEIHGALMDCLREIGKIGWGYFGHTITVRGEGAEEPGKKQPLWQQGEEGSETE